MKSVENMIKSVSLQNANTDSERVNFRDFGKPCKRACHTKKIKSTKQSKEGGQQKQVGGKRPGVTQSQNP